MAKRDDVPGMADRLKAARAKSGLTQTQAGEASGIHQTNISEFEKGLKTPTVATLIKVAAAYGVRACDLIPESVAESPPEQVPVKKKGLTAEVADEPVKPAVKKPTKKE